jgi:hypothetical protein
MRWARRSNSLRPVASSPSPGSGLEGRTYWRRENGLTTRAWRWHWPIVSAIAVGIWTIRQSVTWLGGGPGRTRSMAGSSISGRPPREPFSVFENQVTRATLATPTPHASGNGSIMRLAPVPVAYVGLFPEQMGELVRRLTESSLPTHASPQCQSACAYLGVVLCGFLRGLSRERVLDPEWRGLREVHELFPLHPEVLEVAKGSFRRAAPVGSGYVVRSLEAALWAFHDATDFREAVLRAVNLGDDADTTGAVCGQLAGACFGESGIPEDWRLGLAGRGQIDPVVERLVRWTGSCG